jgi:hypothetical protein
VINFGGGGCSAAPAIPSLFLDALFCLCTEAIISLKLSLITGAALVFSRRDTQIHGCNRVLFSQFVFSRVLFSALWCPDLVMIILRGRREKPWKEFRTCAHDWSSLPDRLGGSHAEDESLSLVQFLFEAFDVLGKLCSFLVQLYVQLFGILEARLVHRKDALILCDLKPQPLHLVKGQGSRVRVEGQGLRVKGQGLRVEGQGFRVQGHGLRVKVQGSRVKSQGLGLRVKG